MEQATQHQSDSRHIKGRYCEAHDHVYAFLRGIQNVLARLISSNGVQLVLT